MALERGSRPTLFMQTRPARRLSPWRTLIYALLGGVSGVFVGLLQLGMLSILSNVTTPFYMEWSGFLCDALRITMPVTAMGFASGFMVALLHARRIRAARRIGFVFSGLAMSPFVFYIMSGTSVGFNLIGAAIAGPLFIWSCVMWGWARSLGRIPMFSP